MAVVPSRTEAEARAKYAEYLAHASPEGGLAHFAASTGVDFAKYGLDEPIAFGNTNAIQSAAQAAQQQGLTTRRKLLEQFEATFTAESSRKHSPKSATFVDGIKGFWEKMKP